MKRGFTLIELLVVVSIIGLLSSVVMTSLNSARGKARNAKRLQDISEYRKTFELVYDSYGGYPNPTNEDAWYCLGDYPDNACWDGTYTEDAPLVSYLDDFLPSLPAVTGLVGSWEGYAYRCTDRSGSLCTHYETRWFMEGTSQSCAGEITINPDYSGLGITYCRMVR